MSTPVQAARHERLETIFSEVEALQWAAQFVDPQLNLVWVSSDLRDLLGTDDPDELGYGRNVIQVYLSDLWSRTITYQSTVESFTRELPYYLHGMPGGKEAVRQMFPERWRAEIDKFEPVAPPPLWAGHMLYVQDDLPPVRVHHLTTAVHEPDGELLGYMRVYGPALRARLTALTARGSTAMFERMARIAQPGRRRAAILFADMQSSSALSRKLSSSAYFALIRRLFTAMDELVVHQGGIVGKHAGDGVTAFFLVDDFGTPSACAAGAIEAAHEVRISACRVAEEMAARTGLFEAADCAINVGLHWGGTLFMGQVVTGGRLEVTALGDEVNEGARIQQTARDGALLASKALVERLSAEDGKRIGVDPEEVVYTTVNELPGADAKAMRDAGTLPVTELYASERMPVTLTG
jgi:class 3 adenylate cyclase